MKTFKRVIIGVIIVGVIFAILNVVFRMNTLCIGTISIPWIVAPIIALVAAVGFLVYQVLTNAGVDTTTSETYTKAGSLIMKLEEDYFVDSYVTKTKIEKDNDDKK